MNRLDPDEPRRLAGVCNELGIRYLAAPLTGGVALLKQNQMTVYMSGEPSVIDAAMPIVRHYTATQLPSELRQHSCHCFLQVVMFFCFSGDAWDGCCRKNYFKYAVCLPHCHNRGGTDDGKESRCRPAQLFRRNKDVCREQFCVGDRSTPRV